MSSHPQRRGYARLRRGMALAVGLALLVQVAPGSAQTTQEQLDRARARLKRIQRELKVERAKLAQVRADVEGLTRQILQALRQREALQDQAKATRRKIKRRGRRVQELQGRLNDRAREVYMTGPAGVVEAILEADTLADLTARVSFLDALNEADASTAIGIEVEREELRRFEDDLQDLLAQLEELLARLGEQKEELDAKFAQQAEITRSIEAKLAEAEKLVSKLEKERRAELRALLRAAAGSGAIDTSGMLKRCPVDRPRSYIDDYGYPRPGGRSHQGNDIFAPQGTPIRAPFAGVADEDSNGLGGLVVFVRASDGTYVYNAHMSRYAGVDGKSVSPGDLIGYVGDTGNARGTPYHDHFELHPGGGGAVSPYPFLNSVCGVNGGG